MPATMQRRRPCDHTAVKHRAPVADFPAMAAMCAEFCREGARAPGLRERGRLWPHSRNAACGLRLVLGFTQKSASPDSHSGRACLRAGGFGTVLSSQCHWLEARKSLCCGFCLWPIWPMQSLDAFVCSTQQDSIAPKKWSLIKLG